MPYVGLGVGLSQGGLALAAPAPPGGNFLLLEDGVSYLLLEDGVSRLILE